MLNLCASAAPNLHDCSPQKILKIYAAGLGVKLPLRRLFPNRV